MCCANKNKKRLKLFTSNLSTFWKHSLAEDWIFLALLGVITAVVGFFIEYVVGKCFVARMWFHHELNDFHPAAQYVTWVGVSALLILCSFAFVTFVAPQAIGSGIPEMKTILWGIQLHEYLAFRTGIAKVVGLATALASGLPMGKEGPLVHIASVIANTLSKFMTSTAGFYRNESRNNEMLAAACAIGLAINFSSPVGGVLFSIEVTSSYFASHNYWRGFVAAVFASLANRLLVYWLKSGDTLTAAYQTNFRHNIMFDPQELFVYLLMGAFGGLAGAGFVFIHRKYSLFLRNNKQVSSFFKKSRFIYPTLISAMIASLYFPSVLGKFLMATTAPRQQIIALFANFTWQDNGLSEDDVMLISPWNVQNNFFLTLGIYIAGTYILSIIATTLPVPNGSIVPIFSIGAAFGRMVGEAMHLWFPAGIADGSWIAPVVPGGYAIVGAAAFTAGVTHSISICIVVCEMTGHIAHIIPIMIAVLMSNAISCLLQPSFFDSLIMIKDLPYLPNIHSSKNACESFVKDFMVRDVKYIWKNMTYHQLKDVLDKNDQIKAFPLVDDPGEMILLGSVKRGELTKLVKQQIRTEKRLQEVDRMQREARIRSYEASMSWISPERPTVRRVSLVIPLDDDEGIHMSHSSTSSSLVETIREHNKYRSSNSLDSYHYEITEPSAPHNHKAPNKQSRFQVFLVPEEAQKRIIEGTEDSDNADGFSYCRTTANDTNRKTEMSPEIRRSFSYADMPAINEERIRGSTSLSTLKKPILKRTEFSEPVNSTLVQSNYATVTGAETGKNKQRFLDALLEKSSCFLAKSRLSLNSNSLTGSRRPSVVADMTAEERKSWEETEMSKSISLRDCQIDPAPFQLVEETSLTKVHSIFSLLGMSHAYVTALGKLVGVVSLKELKNAVENIKSTRSNETTKYYDNTGENGSCVNCFQFLRRHENDSFYGRRISSLRLKTRTKDNVANTSGDATNYSGAVEHVEVLNNMSMVSPCSLHQTPTLVISVPDDEITC